MKISTMFVVLIALQLSPLVSAHGSDSWLAWERGLHRACPRHHVEWVADGGYDELLAAFIDTLPQRVKKQISRITDYDRRCQDTEGFSCEMGMHLDAFRHLGLLGQFTKFGCDHVKCEDIALCSRFPRVK